MDLIIENKAVVLGLLFAISEMLAILPSIKSNSVFEFIYNALKKVAGK